MYWYRQCQPRWPRWQRFQEAVAKSRALITEKRVQKAVNLLCCVLSTTGRWNKTINHVIVHAVGCIWFTASTRFSTFTAQQCQACWCVPHLLKGRVFSERRDRSALVFLLQTNCYECTALPYSSWEMSSSSQKYNKGQHWNSQNEQRLWKIACSIQSHGTNSMMTITHPSHLHTEIKTVFDGGWLHAWIVTRCGHDHV